MHSLVLSYHIIRTRTHVSVIDHVRYIRTKIYNGRSLIIYDTRVVLGRYDMYVHKHHHITIHDVAVVLQRRWPVESAADGPHVLEIMSFFVRHARSSAT